MSYVGNVISDGSTHLVASTLYGTCSTASGTAEKVVTLANFDELLVGATVHVKFQYSNTADEPTLNVNGTGAMDIYTDGVSFPGKTPLTSWSANSVVSFTYDGTAWRMNDVAAPAATNTSALLNLIYPVGAIYMSTNNTDPGTLFGGTWTQIKDTFLLAAGTSHAAGSTGGAESVTLETTNIPTHSHGLSSIKSWINDHVHSYTKPPSTTGGTTLTINQMPSHNHGSVSLTGAVWNIARQTQETPVSANGVFSARNTGTEYVGWATSGGQTSGDGFTMDASHTHTSQGGGQSHNHSITNSTANVAKATAWDGDSTDTTGSGASFSIMNPYLAVYVWKRVA